MEQGNAIMPLSDFLQPANVRLLEGNTKQDVFRELADVISSANLELDRDTILQKVWDRENSLSTRISNHVAVPHAIIDTLDKPVAALGISRGGVKYDPKTEEKVHLIVMMLGNERDHLSALRELALVLHDEEAVQTILRMQNVHQIYSWLVHPPPIDKGVTLVDESQITNITVHHAIQISHEITVSKIIVYLDAHISQIELAPLLEMDNTIFISIGDPDSRIAGNNRIMILPFREVMKSAKIDVTMLFLLSQGAITRNDTVLHILGDSNSGMLDTITVTPVDKDYRLYSLQGKKADLGAGTAGDVSQHVLLRSLQISQTLAVEGREGKPVGTLFVIGDYEHVKKYCQQLIINPFRGYPESERNILDPSLEETVKEFARIDGAFVIKGDGTIVSVGTYIQPGDIESEHMLGLGARHATAAAISACTDAFSLAVSESTRKISLYREGRRFLFF